MAGIPAASFAALKNIRRRARWSPGNAVPVIRFPEGGRVYGTIYGRRRESKIPGYRRQSNYQSVLAAVTMVLTGLAATASLAGFDFDALESPVLPWMDGLFEVLLGDTGRSLSNSSATVTPHGGARPISSAFSFDR